MKKHIFKIILIIFLVFGFTSVVNATNYIYYYGDGCSYCANVGDFFEKNNIEEKFNILKKEVYSNDANRDEFLKVGEAFGLPLSGIGVPFMVDMENKAYYSGDKPIIEFFEEKIENDNNNNNNTETPVEKPQEDDKKQESETKTAGFWKFFLILLPAALSDSINPCAFAVLFLLLSSILSKFNSYRKAIISGLLFSLAIFISYFLMGIGIYKVLSFSNQIFYIKLGVGILGILVGLANIKDYFWYGKVFVMEVPFAWRPKMKAILNKVVSPIGAFIAGFIVSLFLLPCTSGPYLTLLGYLAAEDSSLNLMGYIYMFIYNIIFVLPMVIITLIIGLGVKDVSELKEYKEYHKENIHLIVGIMMLLLGGYIMWELFLK